MLHFKENKVLIFNNLENIYCSYKKGSSYKKPKPQASEQSEGVFCSLSESIKPDAKGLVLIKPGTKQWIQAVTNIKKGAGGTSINYKVENIEDAKRLLFESRGNMNKMRRYKSSYVRGYEVHPSEAETKNAPHNNLAHLAWKDWSKKAKENKTCGTGHIFFDSNGSVAPLRKGE